MQKQQRWIMIMEACQKQSLVRVEDLVNQLHVSPATVRRDLTQMEELRMVRRCYGGVSLDSAQSNEPGMMMKSGMNAGGKHAVARLAASLIHDHQMVFIDAGSSTLEMLDYIAAKNITVVTCGIPHIEKLGKAQIRTIVLGGTVRWSTSAVSGHTALHQLERLFFDVAFIGVNGIHDMMGFTTTNQQEADTKRMVIAHSKCAYIMADRTKFHVLYPESFAQLSDAIILSDELGGFPCERIRYCLSSGEVRLKQQS